MLAVAVICLLFTLFLLVIRRMAYVQLFDDHFRIVTPSLRLNVSYSRLQTSVISRMAELFASRRLSSRQRQIIEPVLGNTVVVLHLSSYPIPRSTLGLFLSPFQRDHCPVVATAGALAGFCLLYLTFSKIFPIVSIWEVERADSPGQQVASQAAAHGGREVLA